MKKVPTSLTTSIALAVCAAFLVVAQGATIETQQEHPQFFTGCLAEEAGGGYVLTLQNDEQITAVGSPDLANHVGHIVRLMGELNRPEQAVFTVLEVQLLENRCN